MRCNCNSQVECPLSPGDNGWGDKVYPDGTAMYRVLKHPVELPSSGIVPGDACSTDGQGRVWVEARALDPDRLVKYVRAKMNRRCRF